MCKRLLIPLALAAAVACPVSNASACPFCTALKPTLAQRRDGAAVAAVGELVSTTADERIFRLHKVLAGQPPLRDDKTLFVPRRSAGPSKPGSLAILLATRTDEDGPLSWEVVPANELACAYFVRAPAQRLPTAERLKFFAGYLEHADALLAEDAYLEFGHAPYDEVRQAADLLPMPSLRKWIVDPRVPPERKGFYGLALGLARSDADRQANVALLRKLALEPADDFRAGFDGVLGGYLVAAGEPALDLIEERILGNARAAEGDVRHAQTALRFCHEFGRQSVPPQRLCAATRRLLSRPEFAASATIDLARWQDWEALEVIVGMFGKPGNDSPETARAIVGYLLACPQPRAARELARLRTLDSKTVADAEKHLSLLGPAR